MGTVNPYALLIAVRLTLLFVTGTIVLGVVIWALVQLVVRLVPVRMTSGNASITSPRRAPRTEWAHPPLWAALVAGALLSNAFDIVVRHATSDIVGSLLTLVVTEALVVAPWLVTGRRAARAMTWQPVRESTLRIGKTVLPTPVAPAHLERREHVTRVVQSIPVDRFRLGPLNLVRADNLALSLPRATDEMIRVAWVIAVVDDGHMTLASVLGNLTPGERALIDDLASLRALPVPEWAALQLGAHAEGPINPHTAALEIERSLGTRGYLHWGRPIEDRRTSFFMRFGPFDPVFVAPWSMVRTVLPQEPVTIAQVRAAMTVEGETRPDEIGNARAIAIVVLRDLPERYGVSAPELTTRTAFRAMELCNGADQTALAATWLDPLVEAGRMSRRELSEAGVSEPVLEVLDALEIVRESVRKRSPRPIFGAGIRFADRFGDRSLDQLAGLAPGDALQFRVDLVRTAQANVESRAGRDYYM